MYGENNLTRFKSLKPHFLTFGVKSSFAKILKTILKSKKIEIVHIQKPNAAQMTAVLIARILGKKFVWMQNFSNPPVPNFYTRLLLSQPDRILVKEYKEVKKLTNFGISKGKIRVLNSNKLEIKISKK